MQEYFFFPNLSMAGIFYAAVLLLLIPFMVQPVRRRWQVLTLPAAGCLFVLLVLSGSRSGWLALLSGCFYLLWPRLTVKWKAAGLLLLCGAFTVLLFYKQGSTSGRAFIYRVSFSVWKDHWLTGTGPGCFKALYNQYQAAYFQLHGSQSQEAMLADDTFYAFNDYLQWAIEGGVAGIVVAAVIISLLVKLTCRQRRLHALQRGAAASLSGVAVSALFSYPLQLPVMQAWTVLCAGVLAFSHAGYAWRVLLLKLFTILAAACIITSGVQQAQMHHRSAAALRISLAGYRKEAVQHYSTLTKLYPHNGYNWFLLAREWYGLHEPGKALDCINNCLPSYCDHHVYLLKAAAEAATGNDSAAVRSYRHAINMVPSRLTSRYELVQFYLSRHDTASAMAWCRDILSLPVKVPSAKAEFIRREAGRWVGGEW